MLACSAGLCRLSRSIYPHAMNLLWDTIFFGDRLGLDFKPQMAPVFQLYEGIQSRRRSGKPVHCRRLCINTSSIRHLVAEPGTNRLLQRMILDLQPQELYMTCHEVMLFDNGWIEGAHLPRLEKLTVFSTFEDDLRGYFTLLQPFAETLKSLTVAIGCLGDHEDYDGFQMKKLGFFPKLPALTQLVINQAWWTERFSKPYVDITFYNLLQAIPDECSITVYDHYNEWGKDLPPWGDRTYTHIVL